MPNSAYRRQGSGRLARDRGAFEQEAGGEQIGIVVELALQTALLGVILDGAAEGHAARIFQLAAGLAVVNGFGVMQAHRGAPSPITGAQHARRRVTLWRRVDESCVTSLAPDQSSALRTDLGDRRRLRRLRLTLLRWLTRSGPRAMATPMASTSITTRWAMREVSGV